MAMFGAQDKGEPQQSWTLGRVVRAEIVVLIIGIVTAIPIASCVMGLGDSEHTYLGNGCLVILAGDGLLIFIALLSLLITALVALIRYLRRR